MRRALGCIVVAAVCIAVPLLLILAGSATVPLLAAVSLKVRPVDTSGECSRSAIEQHLDEGGLEPLLAAAYGDADDEAVDLTMADVPRLRALRDQLAAAEVAPCLKGLQGEEVAVADEIIRAVQVSQAPTESKREAAVEAVRLIWIVGVRLHRIRATERQLAGMYGASGAE